MVKSELQWPQKLGQFHHHPVPCKPLLSRQAHRIPKSVPLHPATTKQMKAYTRGNTISEEVYAEYGAWDEDRHTENLELDKHDGEHGSEGPCWMKDGSAGQQGHSPAGKLHPQLQAEIFLT